VGSALGLIFRWRRVAPAERVLLWWGMLGIAELLVHDVGNERRFVFLIPALAGLAALLLARDRQLLDGRAGRVGLARAAAAAPVVIGCCYLVAGPLVRVPFLEQLHANVFHAAVRWSAAAAVVLAFAIYVSWPRVPGWLAAARFTAPVGVAIVLAVMSMDLLQYVQWAARRTAKNYEAMLAIGRDLPPGTVVHGKLANGMDLENRIVPLFVGRGFGNYEDRATRTDARYLLTYSQPSFGYESQARNPVTLEVLAACPGWKVIREYAVAETPGGHDRAVLIDKYPNGR